MTRTQLAFRLEKEKATQFKEKIKHEGKSLNVVLERLVDAYLEGKLTDGNSTVTGDNNGKVEESAIAQLTNKINQLEKQLTPVTQLLAVTTTDKDSFPNTGNEANGSSELATVSNENELADISTRNNVSSKLASANNEGNDNNELASVSSKVTTVSSEITDGSNGSGESESAIALSSEEIKEDDKEWISLSDLAKKLELKSNQPLSDAAYRNRKGRDQFEFNYKKHTFEVKGKGKEALWRLVK